MSAWFFSQGWETCKTPMTLLPLLQKVLWFWWNRWIGFFFFFSFLLISKWSSSCIWIPLKASEFVMKYEKLLHVTSDLHTSSRGVATPTSLQWQKINKGLLGPQVSFEEVRCHYIQLKVQSFRMNGKTQQEFAQRADWNLFALHTKQAFSPSSHSHIHKHKDMHLQNHI